MPETYTRPPRIWKRLALGVSLVLVASIGATTVAALHEVDKVVDAFKNNPGFGSEVDRQLASAREGRAQTIMVIGSDRRSKDSSDAKSGVASGARSDTLILVRLDPKKQAIALLSLPRDLRVQIPAQGNYRGGVDKLNAAFAYGGAKLTLKTVKRFTGLQINHIVNVNFKGFKEAVNQINCVYADVDRRYFNDNSQGGENYATIDVKPGYQKLCGQKALDYVRFRHEDNDLVRSARQQDFLRQAKQQVPPEKLFNQRDRLLRIFGKYTQSDIRSRKAVLRLLKLGIASAGNPIKEVHFRGKIGKTYVTSGTGAVKKMSREFLGVKGTKGPRGVLRPKGRRRSKAEPSALEDASSAGREQGLKAVAGGARFQVFYPRKRTQSALFAGDPRVYAIRAPNGHIYQSYRMVIKRGLVGEYYGLQGTTWKKPPILKGASTKRTIRGRQYEIHLDGDRVRLVAWRTSEGVYWVSNTLLQTLSVRQMLDIAKSARTVSS